MSLIRIALPLAAAAGLIMTVTPANAASATACKFDRLPLMLIISRGGMGASDNTLQIGDAKPVPISIGSSMMLANSGAQEFTLSIRLPASVTVNAPGNDSVTYDGACIGSEI